MRYETPDFQRLYESEKETKEFWIDYAKDKERTLRDQFAMAALTGWLSSYDKDAGFPTGYVGGIAESCYMMADAMLKAREGV